MIYSNYKEAAPKENPHKVKVCALYNHDNAQVMHMTLQPGESLKPHATPVDVFFYVLEGKPTILVGEESIQFEQDTLIESPKDIMHCISNKTDSIARILVVKAPKPMAKTIFV